MPSLITGLKYLVNAKREEFSEEEHLLSVFADLRMQFDFIKRQFKITNYNGEEISDFSQFLNVAVSNNSRTILNGSGNIFGMEVRDASLEYDLSSVEKLTRYWDQSRDGGCHSCRNHYYQQVSMEMQHACKAKVYPMIWKNCPKYDSKLRNFQGKPARRLAELIEEASAQAIAK